MLLSKLKVATMAMTMITVGLAWGPDGPVYGEIVQNDPRKEPRKEAAILE